MPLSAALLNLARRPEAAVWRATLCRCPGSKNTANDGASPSRPTRRELERLRQPNGAFSATRRTKSSSRQSASQTSVITKDRALRSYPHVQTIWD